MTKAEPESRIRELEALIVDKDLEIQRLRFAQSKPYVGDVPEILPFIVQPRPFDTGWPHFPYYPTTTTGDRTDGFGHATLMAVGGN